MPGFRDRLRKAIQAGTDAQQRLEADRRQARQHEQKMHALYDRYEYQLRDHAEGCLQELCEQWPGFRIAPVTSDKGRGYAISRDDASRGSGSRRGRRYSRLEVLVRPYARHHFLEVLAKGTIRNKEVLRRSEDDRLETLDLGLLKRFVERTVVEFARDYAQGHAARGS